MVALDLATLDGSSLCVEDAARIARTGDLADSAVARIHRCHGGAPRSVYARPYRLDSGCSRSGGLSLHGNDDINALDALAKQEAVLRAAERVCGRLR